MNMEIGSWSHSLPLLYPVRLVHIKRDPCVVSRLPCFHSPSWIFQYLTSARYTEMDGTVPWETKPVSQPLTCVCAPLLFSDLSIFQFAAHTFSIVIFQISVSQSLIFKAIIFTEFLVLFCWWRIVWCHKCCSPPSWVSWGFAFSALSFPLSISQEPRKATDKRDKDWVYLRKKKKKKIKKEREDHLARWNSSWPPLLHSFL